MIRSMKTGFILYLDTFMRACKDYLVRIQIYKNSLSKKQPPHHRNAAEHFIQSRHNQNQQDKFPHIIPDCCGMDQHIDSPGKQHDQIVMPYEKAEAASHHISCKSRLPVPPCLPAAQKKYYRQGRYRQLTHPLFQELPVSPLLQGMPCADSRYIHIPDQSHAVERIENMIHDHRDHHAAPHSAVTFSQGPLYVT